MAQVDPPSLLGIPGYSGEVEIGRGGFGVVYRAHQQGLARDVAIKILTATAADAPDRGRFERERRAMGALSNHPNIVTVFDSGYTEGGAPYLVMAYMPGGSIADRLERDGTLPWTEAVAIAAAVGDAVGAAHAVGVLHRDIKPANILLSQYGAPALGDFGIASVASGATSRTGHVTASISFAAPEVLEGTRPTVASDVYSLGATAVAMITGRAPHERTTDELIAPLLVRIFTEPPPDLRPLGVPDDVCRVLEAALAKEPGSRPGPEALAGRLRAALERPAAAPLPPLPAPGSPAPRPDPPSASRTPAWGGGARPSAWSSAPAPSTPGSTAAVPPVPALPPLPAVTPEADDEAVAALVAVAAARALPPPAPSDAAPGTPGTGAPGTGPPGTGSRAGGRWSWRVAGIGAAVAMVGALVLVTATGGGDGGGDGSAAAPTRPPRTVAVGDPGDDPASAFPTTVVADPADDATTVPPRTVPPASAIPTTGPRGHGAPAATAAVVRGDPLAGAAATGLTRGVTDDAVRIGCVTTSVISPGGEAGFRARIERANADGGVHGRRLELVCVDDPGGTDPVARLVDQEQVFAILSSSVFWDQAATDAAGARQTPVVGAPVNAGFCAARWLFTAQGCPVGETLTTAVPHAVVPGGVADAALAALRVDPGGAIVAVVHADLVGFATAGAQAAMAFAARGAEVVDAPTLPVAPGPDFEYGPVVAAVAGADLVYGALTADAAAGLAAALRDAGSKTSVVTSAYSPGLLDVRPDLAAALEGTYLLTTNVPSEERTPYLIQVDADLAASSAPVGTVTDAVVLAAYEQADLLVQLLTAAGPDLDTATFDAAANAGSFVYEPAPTGGPGPMAFPEGHFLPADCAAVLEVTAGQVVPVERFACYDSIPVR